MAEDEPADAHEELARIRTEREEREERRRRLREEDAALYRDETASPRLRHSFAIYLDELGTSEHLKSLTDEDLAASLNAQEGLRWFLSGEEGLADSDRRVLSFSDNVVVGAPFVDRRFHADGGLSWHLSSVAAYQFNMAVRGRFLRGGIADGPLYIDGSHVTGLALVDAVHLEEHLAIYPRVVLSSACVEMSVAEREGWSGWLPSTLADDTLLVDADGQVFINYVKVAAADDDWPDDRIALGLSEHRDQVAGQLMKHAASQSVRAKYVWCAQLHNEVARAVTNSDDFAVSEGLTSTESRMPRVFQSLGRGRP
jgi:hypothetical protein